MLIGVKFNVFAIICKKCVINDEGNGHGRLYKITFSARSWSAPPEIAGFCFQGFVLIRANDRLRKHHCLYKKKLGFSRPTLGWPRTKMLLVPNVFFAGGEIMLWMVLFDWANVIFKMLLVSQWEVMACIFIFFFLIFFFIASNTHTEKKQKLHRINKVIKRKKKVTNKVTKKNK